MKNTKDIIEKLDTGVYTRKDKMQVILVGVTLFIFFAFAYFITFYALIGGFASRESYFEPYGRRVNFGNYIASTDIEYSNLLYLSYREGF